MGRLRRESVACCNGAFTGWKQERKTCQRVCIFDLNTISVGRAHLHTSMYVSFGYYQFSPVIHGETYLPAQPSLGLRT